MRICMLNITSGNMCWGYRNYLARLVPRLVAHPDVKALLVGMPQDIDISHWQNAAPSVRWLPLRCTLSSRGREIGRAQKRVIEEFSPNVLFVPTARYWSFDGVPVVNMVRNMMPTTRPYAANWLDRMKNWGRFVQMRSAAEKSTRVVAVSQYVRDYLADSLRIPGDKIGVVHHGIEVLPEESSQRPAGISDTWRGNFAFVAGSIYAYRGLEDVILAWDRMRSHAVCPFLAIAGFVGHGMGRYYEGLKRMIKDRNLSSQVRFIGALTREEMTWCYQNCAVFVMTSRVEACPNIALEAMGHGCLCVSNGNPPMPEIFEDAARYYPAGNASALAHRIIEVLEAPQEQQGQARQVGLRRAAEFSWDVCCERTVRELQRAITS